MNLRKNLHPTRGCIEAYPQEATGLAEGEALVLRPDQRGGIKFISRVKLDEWPALDAGP
jgi:hypothetical protein